MTTPDQVNLWLVSNDTCKENPWGEGDFAVVFNASMLGYSNTPQVMVCTRFEMERDGDTVHFGMSLEEYGNENPGGDDE